MKKNLFIVILLLILLTGCYSSDKINIKISGSIELYVNEKIQLQVDEGTNKDYEWKSNDTNIATVSEGVVVGISVGRTEISIIKNDKILATHNIEVKSSSKLTLTGESVLYLGDKIELKVTSDFVGDQFIWSSSNADIATVVNGEVTGNAEGIVTIEVQSINHGKAKMDIRVIKTLIPKSIKITGDYTEYYVGEGPYLFKAESYPSYTSQACDWEILGNEATLNKETGEIRFLEKGVVYVMCRSILDQSIFGTLKVFPKINENAEITNMVFIGNSLTYVNDVPKMVEKIALANGKNVHTERITPGGNTLEDTINSSSSTIINTLQSKPFDYVIIQDHSSLNFLNYNSFLTSATYINNLANTYGAKLVLYQTWAYRENSIYLTGYNLTRSEMQDKINESYSSIAHELNVDVNQVGEIFYAFSLAYPEIELYRDDNHASLAGSYLSSCVHVVSLLKESVIGNGYDVELDADTKLLIQTFVSNYLLNN